MLSTCLESETALCACLSMHPEVGENRALRKGFGLHVAFRQFSNCPGIIRGYPTVLEWEREPVSNRNTISSEYKFLP